MKQAFKNKLRLNAANKVRLNQINNILEEYTKDGYTLTLRQLYYQLVSRDMVPNDQKEYAKLIKILKQGRMCGIVDWSAIEDRVRRPKLPYWVKNPQDAMNNVINTYRKDRMKTQSGNLEVWVEKDALSNVLYRVTEKYHVRLMVNRGYSSVSAMYDAHKRFKDGDTILYFGDHDPSGLDMIRDIRERMQEFGLEINVIPVALNMQQIQQFNPPPNPAKVTDPRAKWYMSTFGDTSWELDALPPKELISMTESAIEKRIDMNKWQKMVDQEKKERNNLLKILNTPDIDFEELRNDILRVVNEYKLDSAGEDIDEGEKQVVDEILHLFKIDLENV